MHPNGCDYFDESCDPLVGAAIFIGHHRLKTLSAYIDKNSRLEKRKEYCQEMLLSLKQQEWIKNPTEQTINENLYKFI